MKKQKLAIEAKKCRVFFDFDNTISTHDIIDDMLMRFSKDNLWQDLEEKWLKGKIGSKECLRGQIKGISITKKRLDAYLDGIKIDPYFKKLAGFLNEKNVKIKVLSDNFDYILKGVIRRNRIRNLKLYSNKLRFAKNRLIPQFPFQNPDCDICAHCKTKNLLAKSGKSSIIIYIGDGYSDNCPAQYADIVFAKADLLRYFKDKRLPHKPYGGLKDVYRYLKRSFK